MTTIIVGAGAAGITAAYTLLQQGFSNFIVLEASSTYLGRVKKIDTFTNHPIDLGGEWVHVKPDILNTLINNPNVDISSDVVTTPYIPDYFYYDGTQLNVETYIWEDYKFVNYTWYDFFDTYIVPDIIDKITFNCAVSKVEWIADTSTKVTCTNGQVYSGSKTIIAVPLSALQEDITFVPTLSSTFTKALAVPVMLNGLKVLLRFTTKFYPGAFIIYPNFANDSLIYSYSYFYDITYGQNQPLYNIMGIFIIGEAADEYVVLSDEDMIQRLLNELDTIFGSNIASTNYITGLVQNWSNETYIRGGYSDYAEDYPLMDILRKPISNVLYFAGEAIPVVQSGYANGYVHGAALSGRQAAMDTLRTDGFYLIDSDSDNVIERIGSYIDYEVLYSTTAKLNIEAFFANPRSIQSVKVTFDNPSISLCETKIPFSIFRDGNGDFRDAIIPIGTHKVSATAYSRPGCRGHAGTSISHTFDVYGCHLEYYSILDNGDGDLFQPLEDGTILSSGCNISIAVYPHCGFEIEQVTMVLRNTTKVVRTSTEKVAPYSLFANVGRDFNKENIAAGAYSLTVTIDGVKHEPFEFTIGGTDSCN